MVAGPLIEKMVNIKKVNKRAHEEYKTILAEIGAEETYYQIDNKLVALVFESEPDRALYKKVHSGWYPKKNSKKGKELCARLDKVKALPENSCLAVVGLPSSPTIFGCGKCYTPTVLEIPSDPIVCYVAVPWYDEDPEILEKYKEDRANGTHFRRDLDSILWEPTTDMEEIKEWEYLKAIEEWNDSIRDRAA